MRELTHRAGLCAAALVTAVLAAGCSGGSHGGSGGGKGGAAAAPTTGAPAQAPQGDASQQVLALIQSGIDLAGKHDEAGAQATFQKVLEIDPANKYAWFDLGVIAQKKGDSATALTDYGHALKEDPAFTPALYNKALALQVSDPGQAEDLLRQAVAADPKASTAYLHLGLLLQKSDRQQAQDAFDKAVALDSSLEQYVPEGFRDDATPEGGSGASSPADGGTSDGTASDGTASDGTSGGSSDGSTADSPSPSSPSPAASDSTDDADSAR